MCFHFYIENSGKDVVFLSKTRTGHVACTIEKCLFPFQRTEDPLSLGPSARAYWVDPAQSQGFRSAPPSSLFALFLAGLLTQAENSLLLSGECVIALKSMIGSTAQQFLTYLSHRGEETGNIRGSMKVRVPAERMGTRERLYGEKERVQTAGAWEWPGCVCVCVGSKEPASGYGRIRFNIGSVIGLVLGSVALPVFGFSLLRRLDWEVGRCKKKLPKGAAVQAQQLTLMEILTDFKPGRRKWLPCSLQAALPPPRPRRWRRAVAQCLLDVTKVSGAIPSLSS